MSGFPARRKPTLALRPGRCSHSACRRLQSAARRGRGPSGHPELEKPVQGHREAGGGELAGRWWSWSPGSVLPSSLSYPWEVCRSKEKGRFPCGLGFEKNSVPRLCTPSAVSTDPGRGLHGGFKRLVPSGAGLFHRKKKNNFRSLPFPFPLPPFLHSSFLFSSSVRNLNFTSLPN